MKLVSIMKCLKCRVHTLSYGCMWEVAKHERNVKVSQGNS